MKIRHDPILLIAVITGGSYLPADWLLAHTPALIAWKGAGVALLALWAASKARGFEGWWIVAVLALGAMGDVLIDTAGLVPGALAFLTGHLIAIPLYLRHRRDEPWSKMLPIALGRLISFQSWRLFSRRIGGWHRGSRYMQQDWRQ